MSTAEIIKKRTADSDAVPRHARGRCELGVEFHRRGWSLATSSNYSVVLQRKPLELLVTASGKHKNRLSERDFVRVDGRGRAIEPQVAKSSAETLLHVAIASHLDVGAILHTHSVWATLLSDRYFTRGGLEIAGFEMLKGLDDVDTHEHAEWLPIFANTQDMPVLAEKVASVLAEPNGPIQHGFLIRRHGLYTWGRDLEDARRHVETLEFLLECVGRQLWVENTMPNPRDHIADNARATSKET
jgi:methylthioribulose-1-phosphate dehydratase